MHRSSLRMFLSMLIIAVMALGFTLAPAFGRGGPPGQETICHIPPGNPSAAHTITVGAPAVQAHLGHGDTLGPCPIAYP